MSEYIRRQDALVSIRQYQYPYGVEFLINNLPAADVAVVKHGKWIEYPRAHYFKCSECKETVPYKKAVLIRGKRKYKYCPHCGAKMGAEG